MAEGKSARQFYIDLLGANGNLANVMYLDLFPLLRSVGIPANFSYLASIFRSVFRLANPQDSITDEHMLSDGLPDKRLYETMRQRVLGLKEILNDVAGPELIAELGKGYVNIANIHIKQLTIFGVWNFPKLTEACLE